MRKAVKLAAVSTIAAVAMVGGSATAATAQDGFKKGGDEIGVNVCGNEAGSGWGQSSFGGEAEVEEVEDNVFFDSVVCQNGKENFGPIANRNDYDGLGLEDVTGLLDGILG